MSYQIREAESKDADQISACIRESFKKYIPLIQMEPEPMILDYASVIEEDHVFVMEEDGDFVGALILKDGDGSFMWLDIIGVFSKHQSKGCGKKLIEFGESAMREKGATESRLYTNTKFESNIAIYKHLGYEIYDRKTEHGYDRVFFRKPLK
jgi:GNAT superfamily N-acetyltransferase